MKLRLLSLPAVLLFTAGVLTQLIFSSSMVWAEMEASIFGTQITAGGLNLSCPLMLSSSESSTVIATVTNTLHEQVSPLVTTEISKSVGYQSLNEALTLAPYQTRTVAWSINDTDVIFGRLILVHVIQGGYGDLALRHGYCGILIFNLLNLSGNQSLILFVFAGLILVLAGGVLWRRIHEPLDDAADQTIKACGGLTGVTTLALFTALPRWWGLTLFLDAFALIMISVIFTDFLLFPRHNRS